jgi:hypothetical protein
VIDYSKIPETTLETLTAWIEHARPMGHFCSAVVANDLREACARADEYNRAVLFEIVAWLHNHAPIGSWGSRASLKRWPRMRVPEEGEMIYVHRKHPQKNAHSPGAPQ